MTGESATSGGPSTEPGPATEPTTSGPTVPAVPIGTPVRDTTRDRIGVVMDRQGPYFQLRPLDGGREWDVAPEHVEPVSAREVLHARVAEANHRSRQGSRR